VCGLDSSSSGQGPLAGSYEHDNINTITSSVPAVLLLGKFDKLLHFLSIFIARKLIIGLTIRFISLYITEKIIPKPSILESRTVFGFVSLVLAISSPKQTTLLLAPFYHAYFPSCRNHRHWDSNPGQFFGVVAFVPVISPSIVHSFRATGTALTETRTQDNFPEFWPFCILFLVSGSKHAKFGTNWYVLELEANTRTQFQFYVPTH
jgi:hypothetical protein